LDWDYKIERSTKHRAKFRADRPTELGDYAAKKKERENHSKTEVLPKTIVFGRTNDERITRLIALNIEWPGLDLYIGSSCTLNK